MTRIVGAALVSCAWLCACGGDDDGAVAEGTGTTGGDVSSADDRDPTTLDASDPSDPDDSSDGTPTAEPQVILQLGTDVPPVVAARVEEHVLAASSREVVLVDADDVLADLHPD